MERSTSQSMLTSVRFIIRHPLIVISTFLIVFSAIMTYFISLPSQYQSFAIISFETSRSGLTDAKFIQRKQDLLKGMLIGENLRKIIKEMWPDLKEESDLRKYGEIVNRLTNARSGIRMVPDKNPGRLGGQDFVTIAFLDRNPRLAFKVVQSTLSVLKTVSKTTTEETIESGINFLREQIELYKAKRVAINEEISRIKSNLKRAYPYLTDQQKSLVDDQIKAISVFDLTAAAEGVGASRLEPGEESLSYLIAMDVQKDPFVREYSQEITRKEITLRELKTQGYLPAHPYVIKLVAEIARLKSFRQARITELTGMNPAETAVRRKGLEGGAQGPEEEYRPNIEQISAEVARLTELKNERDVNERYYNDMRQQLEVSELKGRLERADAGIEIRVIQEPRVPLQPIPSLQGKSIFMGFVVSMIMALGLAYLADSLDDSIKSSSELRQFLMVPVLGSINQINTPQDISARRGRLRFAVIAVGAAVVVTCSLVKAYVMITMRTGI